MSDENPGARELVDRLRAVTGATEAQVSAAVDRRMAKLPSGVSRDRYEEIASCWAPHFVPLGFVIVPAERGDLRARVRAAVDANLVAGRGSEVDAITEAVLVEVERNANG